MEDIAELGVVLCHDSWLRGSLKGLGRICFFIYLFVGIIGLTNKVCI